MATSIEERRRVYDRTQGRCHLCKKKLAFKNYGVLGARAAWEIDHSRPRARDGGDHGNNRLPACISCNRSKQARSSRSVRRENGLARAPMSARQEARARRRNAARGAVIGSLAARVLLNKKNPKTLAGFAAVGAVIGHELDPED